MSYARKGADSDVYVYREHRKAPRWVCCGCQYGAGLRRFAKRSTLAKHMIQHMRAGDRVPDRLWERLFREMESDTAALRAIAPAAGGGEPHTSAARETVK